MSVMERALEQLRALGANPRPGESHDYAAAKRAYIIDRGCKQKARYSDEDAAFRALRILKRRTGMRQWFDVYRCPHCAGLHIATGVRPPGRGKR